jgi:hypothetical protein
MTKEANENDPEILQHTSKDLVSFDWFFCFRKRKTTRKARKNFSHAHKFDFIAAHKKALRFSM